MDILEHEIMNIELYIQWIFLQDLINISFPIMYSKQGR